ncbi:sodium/potassium/calcium exchanger 4-like [Phlebotomus argentipes]|uniref:sodium/potassium/calcium exchanger 4-like n=1 Tax=Phlebotomus argentipes TaxID=94469 RepID=UPI002892FEE4|nr:sodium/potassium/calcium exchanger 4-like [Phlebotomus argentipes]
MKKTIECKCCQLLVFNTPELWNPASARDSSRCDPFLREAQRNSITRFGLVVMGLVTLKNALCAGFVVFLISGLSCTEAFPHKEIVEQISQANDILPSFPILNDIREIYLTPLERFHLVATKFSWYPWYKEDATFATDDIHPICENRSSIDDLPDDLFTQEQRLQGAIILHFLGAIYFFTMLGIVCNNYFIPAVECICEDLKISRDVAAATFMAVSGTIPELFTNLISTFITDSPMGLGAIIGSLLYNTLGVAAVCGLATISPVQINWFPLGRDCFILFINSALLTGFIWDGEIAWYEAMVMVICSILYFIVLFQNPRIERLIKSVVEDRWNCFTGPRYNMTEPEPKRTSAADTQQRQPPRPSSNSITPSVISVKERAADEANPRLSTPKIEPPKKSPKSLFKIPNDKIIMRIWFFYSWPIQFFLRYTVPSPKYHRRWYPLTFIMCIALIGGIAFMVFWMIAIIGYTFYIPESVMGMTLLAWGSCMPEAVACVLVIRKGIGGMGVSNALGSTSLAILISLGFPWFVRTLVDGEPFNVVSYGVEFTTMTMLLATTLLFTVLALFRFKLRKTSGIILVGVYAIFVTFAILNEIDIFFASGIYCD